ncbi:PREDICTED: uncharacterized protein C18orf63-like [Priapulus caudatus]|uniref:Uncharacterized protein C18orf63-like n=1 Tax=Priapulus caudatus TaxID=37621 RepID=A0ABM1ESW0_PRICU|nr:PREDICTED: uncharacterized protein C18orf63-like [Priapulus caudatus]
MEPDVIASPDWEQPGQIRVVMQIEFYKTGRIQAYFQKRNLQMDKPTRVTPAIFQSCMNYSLYARMAPHWNKVSDILIQGRDFIVNSSGSKFQNAIRMRLVVKEAELYISLQGFCVRIPCLQYGYRLPESEDSMLYFQVYFRAIGSNLFTYPTCCVRSADIQYQPRCDPAPIVTAFMNELQAKVGSICGHTLTFTRTPSFSIPRLYPASQPVAHSNLTATSPPVATPYRSIFTPPVPLAHRRQEASTQPATQRGHHGAYVSPPAGADGSPPSLKTAFLAGAARMVTKPASSAVDRSPDSAAGNDRIVPWFKPQNSARGQLRSEAKPTSRIVPIFRPAKVAPAQAVGRKVPPSTGRVRPAFSSTVAPPRLSQVDSTAPSCNIAQKPGPNFAGIPPRHPSSVPRPGMVAPLHRPFTAQLTESGISHVATQLSNSAPVPGLPRGHSHQPSHGRILPSPATSQLNQGIMKRQAQGVGDEGSKIKKPRVKPQVQENVNVEEYATYNQLGKLNTVTLLSWLRQKGVACKAKDKKQDLIDKIMLCIAARHIEQ